jgi:Carboxypeptidase regulatory-like domain
MKSILMTALLLTCAMSFAKEKDAVPLPEVGSVSLSLDEYNRLIELASKPPKKLDLPPLSYSLKCADLRIRVEDDDVRGTLRLEGEVFKKGMVKVPLTSGMTVLEAKQQGQVLPLQQERGTEMAVLSGPGEFSIELEVALPVAIEAGRASFTLPTPAAGSVRLALSIPGEHTNVKMNPGLITERSSDKGRTAIEAVLEPGRNASVYWTTREVVTQAVPKEARFVASAKTMVSVSEAELRSASLVEVNVIQGEPEQFELTIPSGFEVTGVTGPTLDASEVQSGVLTLRVNAPAQRNHQFLVSMEKALSSTSTDAPFLSIKNAQRETGEVLVEGAGTLELTAKEGGGLKRMDVKEANPYLRSLGHYPPQAAFRYHRQPSEMPTLALEWVRFPDAGVLAAVAENAEITTLVTTEGKTLTEVKLTVKNQAQPFLKVGLPAGATILSADVEGEKVKPVQGPDGNRVPLLRAGFRPTGSYTVSYVFMHSGAPFAKKGGSELVLPNMDVPISVMHWEVFLPERYKVKDFGGDVTPEELMQARQFDELAQFSALGKVSGGVDGGSGAGVGPGHAGGIAGGIYGRTIGGPISKDFIMPPLMPGQIGGFLVDPTGAPLPNATVKVKSLDTGEERIAVTDPQGFWMASGFRSGRVEVRADATGFNSMTNTFNYDANRPPRHDMRLELGAATETVEVTGEASQIELRNGRDIKKQAATAPASANVTNLQRRVAGVLPVAVDVPKAGVSFRFMRALVLDEETRVTFNYKTR